MQAAAYIRCSTEEQANSGLGLQAQREKVWAYATMKGLDLVAVLEDAGVSGGKPLATRPAGAELLKMLKSKRATVVIVLKLDRAFRNCGDCLTTAEQWERQGVTLHIVDLGGNAIDTASAAGKFMLTVLAGAAEMERNLTRERTRAAMGVLRRDNRLISRRVPFGFDLAPDGRTLTLNPSEQQALDMMKHMRAEGLSLAAIARKLDAEGIAPKSGQRWHPDSIRGILTRATRKAG